MEEEKVEDQDSLNSDSEQDTIPDGEETDKDTESEGSEESDGKDWKQIAENQRIRAEKAEAKLKKPPQEQVKVHAGGEKSELSQSDLIYLAKADIHEDDIPELLEIAKVQGKSLKEVHSLSWVRSFLDERKEERATAEATTTGNKRSGTRSPSASELQSKFQSKGELPEKQEDIDSMVGARFDAKTK